MYFSGAVGWSTVLAPLIFSNVDKLYSNNSNDNDLLLPFYPVFSKGITSPFDDGNRKEMDPLRKKEVRGIFCHIFHFKKRKIEN